MPIAVAFDGDPAGEKATNEVLLTALNLSETETGFLRAFALDRKPFEDCVGLLANTELADELAFWTNMDKPTGAPDWWHEMCQDFRTACLSEITKRSRQVNDRGGNSYIKTFNDTNTISAVMQSFGHRSVPGRTVRCPMHDDSTPSLSISKDDGRAYCFNQSCILWHDGHGVDAFELDKILSE